MCALLSGLYIGDDHEGVGGGGGGVRGRRWPGFNPKKEKNVSLIALKKSHFIMEVGDIFNNKSEIKQTNVRHTIQFVTHQR